ncbi:MAG TPA: outer membrane beta-barrel protein, partial [Verrucomicrobiae bacterium]
TINQSVQLQWGTTWRDWFLTASQSYSYSDDPEIETGGQTEQQNYSTVFNGIYHFNDKLSLNAGFNQNFVDNGQTTSTNLSLGLVNSRSWSTMNWLNDQVWPRLSVGVGLGLGYNQQQDSADTTFQQYEAQMSWRVTDKISFQLNGGLEDQEYLSGGASALLTPIFGGSAQYQPFEQTKFSVIANRTISTSAYENQNVEATTVTADFNQRLFGGVILDLNGGFSWNNYVASVLTLATARNDDTYTFAARLSCPFPKRGTVSIFYQYSETSSTQSGFAAGSSAFGYSSNQVGLNISYAY